jgi:hypothetical protein
MATRKRRAKFLKATGIGGRPNLATVLVFIVDIERELSGKQGSEFGGKKSI